MKRIALLMVLTLAFVGIAAAASWTGWISCEKCGLKGNNAAHADCAKKCIKAGNHPVLITDSNQILKIANPDKVTPMAGERVVVTGDEKEGVIEVKSVKKAES